MAYTYSVRIPLLATTSLKSSIKYLRFYEKFQVYGCFMSIYGIKRQANSWKNVNFVLVTVSFFSLKILFFLPHFLLKFLRYPFNWPGICLLPLCRLVVLLV